MPHVKAIPAILTSSYFPVLVLRGKNKTVVFVKLLICISNAKTIEENKIVTIYYKNKISTY